MNYSDNNSMNKQVFTTIIEGTEYSLPKWTLTENGNGLTDECQVITFLRGTKDNDNPIVNGISYKQTLVPSPTTVEILQCYKTALELFNKREKDRAERGVINP